ncbi:caspase family protein [Polycyclovorans algicola]|uniref:caspase family protein n=1 Tax=Polycyclovorans algicola TaxID=616992 RepID=UPI0006943FDE|nr:caspase family protein [Polycyclovorans algicola]
MVGLKRFRVLSVLVMAFATLGAQASQRVALVIGNGAYQHTQRLTNPVNDASDISAALRKLGFEVHSGNNLDANSMRSRLQSFAGAANGAELALVFYAGHGIQAEGTNYLIPVDAKLDTPLSLRFQGIAMSDVMAATSGARTKVLLVDACRDNPLANQWASEGRNVSRGLGRIDSTDGGTLIAFATRPGAIAADGAGRNSPFTSALLQHLETPGIELRILLTRVRNRVLELTRNAQEPWTEESLRSEIYLLPGSGSTATAQSVPAFDPRSVELA